MYKARNATQWFLLFIALSGLAATSMAEEKGSLPRDKTEIRLDYKRESVDRRRQSARPQGARPASKSLPAELTIDVEHFEKDEARIAEKRSDGVVSARPRYYGKLREEARRAATWTARELAESSGRRQAYNVGFYDGLHRALDDSHLGRWDFADGLERGRRSRDAERYGSQAGYDAARESAERLAQDEVSSQFHDLSREPRRRSYVETPPMEATLYEARPPRIEEVFRAHPVRGYAGGVDPLPDPWAYYGYRSRAACYDRSWWEAARAFDLWAGRHRRYWAELDDGERSYFKQVFRSEYSRRIAEAYQHVAERAYRYGFDQGWTYGAQISYDWNYRQGYHQGWHEALRESAARAYHRGFPDFYAERYDAYFDEWSTKASPEILRVELHEDNDDGVFEPGESIWVDYEIANYGGAPGRFDVRLEGRVLTAGARDGVELPRRGVRRSVRPLDSVIDASVAPRTRAELGFSVAGLEHRLPIKVSYPLEFQPRVSLTGHDSLAGRAVIEAMVTNASRRAVPAEVSLKSHELARPPAPRYFDEIRPGESRRLAFELDGLHPLDLLGGELDVEIEVASRGRRHDATGYRLPALALDLDERDLLLFMESLARRERIPSHEVNRAQELMLRRLRADWKAVADARGNNYRKDLKQGTRLTALGDLVRTFQSQRRTLRHPEVFTSLMPRLENMIKKLPGTHPFLRRSARKLARQLEG